uniref:beta-glucosidase n=1 Tax=Zooxanthella nutricula TaxID=1333877 RepID=A0A7S2Q2J2_9DINO
MVGTYCKEAFDSRFGQGDAFSGGGSGYVMSHRQVTPLAGVKERFPNSVVTWGASAAAARGADVAVVCAAAHAEEGWDRANLTLPEAESLVAALKQQTPSTKVVVLAIAPGPITAEWVAAADAALLLFAPGEQVGGAAADLLSGAAYPGGRLPVSLPHRLEHRFTKEQYPGTPFNDVNMTTHWSEGVLVGYRWNDAKEQTAAFPFGFGLGYTTFEFRNVHVTCDPIRESATVSLTVANTGGAAGAAVPQVYVGFASLAPALRQLRGFRKVHVEAGGEATVSFELGSEDWSTWDEQAGRWRSAVRSGEPIQVLVGSSSADLPWFKVLPFQEADPSVVMQ